MALFLAIGLDPAVRFIQNAVEIRRGLAVAIVFLGALLVIGGFLAAVIPPLVRQTVRLAQQIPDFAERLSDSSSWFGDLNQQFDISDRVRSRRERLAVACGELNGTSPRFRSLGRVDALQPRSP